MSRLIPGLVLVALAVATIATCDADESRYRVIVSTDIGGTDPDDYQSMVHLLLYADTLDIEGLISSPFGPGRREHILDVIDLYEQDFAALQANSPSYPTADYLRSVTKQGATEVAPYRGYRQPTEGSDWIIKRAMADDSRTLHVLVWGGLEDLAQALHDQPDIASRIRVYWIGGPNKKWSPDAYQYLATEHPELNFIESNATYRGWFEGGNQSGEWGNERFVSSQIAGRGALGDFFAVQLGGVIKMGDSPSVGWLLFGSPAEPARAGWGGRFVRAWTRPHTVFHGATGREDTVEEFGIFELVLRPGADVPANIQARMVVENQELIGHVDDDGNVRFRFSPKTAKEYRYSIRSNVDTLDGLTGALTALAATPEQAGAPDATWPNWWTDNPDPRLAEGPHIGARTVSRWREDYLRDFAVRLSRLDDPVAAPESFGSAMLDMDAEWYASAEARAGADQLMRYQSAQGGWPKNTNLFAKASAEQLAAINAGGRANTIDNDATTEPMRYLSLVYRATGGVHYRDSFMRGLDYLLSAQYENGGWPQFYPLREGYFRRITFNDNAMINTMSLLRDVAEGNEPFDFVDGESRDRAREAVSRGIDCILKTQWVQDGALTAWAAQYDEHTLEPAWARAYEPPSLSGNESVGIVRFLMGIEDPSTEVIAAIEAAVAWFRAAKIEGLSYQRFVDAEGAEDASITSDPAAPPLWARFYELNTNRPLFLGRDSVYRYSLADIEKERRGGYAYYGTWPASLLADDYPHWRQTRGWVVQ